MIHSSLHTLIFTLKNNVEILFRGDDALLSVLEHYRKIFSLSDTTVRTPVERYIVTFKNDPEGNGNYNLTHNHFALIRSRQIEITFNFTNMDDPDDYPCMLMMFSMLLGTIAQQSGGGLIHAALGELNGKGFLLAAPGGTGKTTASSRLQNPFISHCDDTTLLVRDENGKLWAHPFPTWSRFYWGGEGGTWNFEHVLPVSTIFYLQQSETDFVSSLNTAEKVSCCVAAFEQASRMLARNDISKNKINNAKGTGSAILKRHPKDWFAISKDPEEAAGRAIRNQWFENASVVSKHISAEKLNLSLTGNFWKIIETVIKD
jgi:SynChlorMet cassette protein ScmC